MLDASRALATLTDLMVAALPPSAQGQIAALLTRGARLAITTTLIPFPTFKLVLVPPNPQEPLVELVGCAPSADTVAALKSEAVSH